MTENWKEQVYSFAGYAGYVDMIVAAIERYLKFDTSLTIRADIDKEFDNDFIEELTKKALKYYNENQKLINKRFPDDFSLRTEIIRAHLAGYDVDIKKFNIDDYSKWIENKLRNENSIPNQNIVKSTCQELGITQKELAERMGVNDGTPAQWSSKGDIPEMARNFMLTLVENNSLKNKLSNVTKALKLLDEVKGL